MVDIFASLPTAIARFMKEQKTSDLYEKGELVKWVKNASESRKAEQIM